MLHSILEKVRIESAKTYKELIKTNLSLLLEIDVGFDFDSIGCVTQMRHSDTIFGAPLTHEGICTINQLIYFISEQNHVTEVGLFRKSGSKMRIQQLQERICSGTTISISTEFTVHDVCCLLKQFLRELPQPLLVDKLNDLFLQTVKLQSNQKRTDSIRLLLLMLPSVNRQFFHDLIKMFTKITQNIDKNFMNSSNLATIFSPILFLPKDVTCGQFKSTIGSFTDCLTYMIDIGEELFEPPTKLISDCRLYLNKVNSTRAVGMFSSVGTNPLMSTTSLIPTTKFCSTTTTPKDYTQQALAELLVYAQSTEGRTAKERKILKKIKESNTHGNTPITKLKRDKEQQALIKESLKKSGKNQNGTLKSFGTAIKKRLLMTPVSDSKSLKFRNHPNNIFSAQATYIRPTNANKITVSENKNVSESNTSTPKPNINVTHVDIEQSATNMTNQNFSDEKNNHSTDQPKRVDSKIPPPLPPKPTPRTIDRCLGKQSSYSLQEYELKKQSFSTQSPFRNISTKSLPCNNNNMKINYNLTNGENSSPSQSSIKNVRKLCQKYEQLVASSNSKIPRLNSLGIKRVPSKAIAIPYEVGDDATDENYVCLDMYSKTSNRPNHVSLTKIKRSSESPRNSSPRNKSPRSLIPICEPMDDNTFKADKKRCISVRRPSWRRGVLDLNNLQPKTPL